jgi:ferrous iron transport protein A
MSFSPQRREVAPRVPNGDSDPAALSLAQLAPGARARVEGVDPAGPIGQRLLDLGFLPGTEVRLVRRAPLGDPSLYELRGTQLCLRRGEAARVRVRLLGPDPRA